MASNMMSLLFQIIYSSRIYGCHYCFRSFILHGHGWHRIFHISFPKPVWNPMVLHIRFAQKFLRTQIINLQYPHIICCCNFAQNTPNVSTINQQSLQASTTHRSAMHFFLLLLSIPWIIFTHTHERSELNSKFDLTKKIR